MLMLSLFVASPFIFFRHEWWV